MGGLRGSIWLTINKVEVKWAAVAVPHTIYTSDALTLELDRRECSSERTRQGPRHVWQKYLASMLFERYRSII